MVVPSARGSPALVLSPRSWRWRDFLHLRQRHDHPARRVARLAEFVEHVHDAAGNGLGEVAPSRMTFGDFAAEFLLTRLTVGRALGDIDAGAGRTGERVCRCRVFAHGGADFRAEAV